MKTQNAPWLLLTACIALVSCDRPWNDPHLRVVGAETVLYDNYTERPQSNPRFFASGNLSPYRAAADASISPHSV